MNALYNRKHWMNIIKLFSICLLFTVIVKANDGGAFKGGQTVGPSGGDVRTIVVDPKDKDHLFITTLDGQVYTSTDAGNNWQFLVNFNRAQLILDNLIVDSRDSKIIYTSGYRGVKDPGGFFKSIDGGVNWKESKDLKDEAIHALVQSSLDPNILLAGTIRGVWISRNSGDDWEKIEAASKVSPIDVDSVAIDPRNINTIYAGTFWRPYKTTDGGKNWKLISTGMIDDSDVFTVDIDPRNPDNIFASACSGIYYSSNKGENWSKVNGIPSTSRRTRDLLQHPSVAGTVFAATTEGFWMSKNNGKSWSLTTSKELEINSITVHPDAPDRIFIATNNYGVMISNDGGKSFAINNGNFTSRMTTAITTDIEKPNRIYAATNNTATGGGFVFISDDGGVTWKPSVKNLSIIRISPTVFLQDRKNPNMIYLGTNHGLYRSIDRGISWNEVTAPKPVTTGKRAPVKRKIVPKKAVVKPIEPIVTAIAAPPAKLPVLTEQINNLIFTEDGKNGIIAATNSGLYRTYDISAGWERIPFGDGIDSQVFAVATSISEPQTLWVGTPTTGVIVSRDNGVTWEKTSDSIKNKQIPISAIAVNPQNPSVVYVGTQQTFYISRDNGKNWVRKGAGLPIGNFSSILINPGNPNEIFVGNALDINGGLYQSSDGGDTWKRLDTKDESLPSRRIRTIAFDPKNANRIFAGTHSGGIFRIERTPVTASEDAATRPRIAGN
jgi:photosystem II stability/assembly factor-like uncharacterized protein